MTLMRMLFLLLAINICAEANTQVVPNNNVPPLATATTIVLKTEAAGSVFLDGKLKSNAHAGQVLTLSVAPGQHLVSMRSQDGKTVEKIVTSPAGTSTVVLLGNSSEQESASDAVGGGHVSSTVPKEVDLTSFSQDDVDKVKLDAQLKALDALGLFSDELEMVKRFNVKGRTDQAAALEDLIKHIEELNAIDPSGSDTLLGLGKPKMALLSSENEIRDAEDAIKVTDSLKGTCDKCTGEPAGTYSRLGSEMMNKAVAVFATGEQQEGLAAIPDAQHVFIKARSKATTDKDVKRLNNQIDRSFCIMAGMKALMSNWEGCLEASQEMDGKSPYCVGSRVERFDRNGRLMVGQNLPTDCAALAATYPPQSAHILPAGQNSASISSIRTQIDDVISSGRYSALPDPQVGSSAGNGSPNINIKNDTGYSLTVLCAGPAEQSIQIAAGQTSNMPFQAGTYQMVGRVDSPNVLPLYKQYSFTTGSIYNFDFYITAH